MERKRKCPYAHNRLGVGGGGRTSVNSTVIMPDGRGECNAFSVYKYSGKCVWGDKAQSALSAWEGQEAADTSFVWLTWQICQLLHNCTLPLWSIFVGCLHSEPLTVWTERVAHSREPLGDCGGMLYEQIISASAPGKEEYSRSVSHHALGVCLWHAWGQVSEDTKTCLV